MLAPSGRGEAEPVVGGQPGATDFAQVFSGALAREGERLIASLTKHATDFLVRTGPGAGPKPLDGERRRSGRQGRPATAGARGSYRAPAKPPPFKKRHPWLDSREPKGKEAPQLTGMPRPLPTHAPAGPPPPDHHHENRNISPRGRTRPPLLHGARRILLEYSSERNPADLPRLELDMEKAWRQRHAFENKEHTPPTPSSTFEESEMELLYQSAKTMALAEFCAKEAHRVAAQAPGSERGSGGGGLVPEAEDVGGRSDEAPATPGQNPDAEESSPKGRVAPEVRHGIVPSKPCLLASSNIAPFETHPHAPGGPDNGFQEAEGVAPVVLRGETVRAQTQELLRDGANTVRRPSSSSGEAALKTASPEEDQNSGEGGDQSNEQGTQELKPPDHGLEEEARGMEESPRQTLPPVAVSVDPLPRLQSQEKPFQPNHEVEPAKDALPKSAETGKEADAEQNAPGLTPPVERDARGLSERVPSRSEEKARPQPSEDEEEGASDSDEEESDGDESSSEGSSGSGSSSSGSSSSSSGSEESSSGEGGSNQGDEAGQAGTTST